MNVDSEIASVVALVRGVAVFPARIVHSLLPLYGGVGALSFLLVLVRPRYAWALILFAAGMVFCWGGMWPGSFVAKSSFSVFPM